MSLAGNLKDLSLCEILQILGLSRKTGILSLSSNRREGAIFVRQGMVISAFSNESPQSLGELLICKGLADSDTLLTALSRQQAQGFRERLDVILTTQCGLPRDGVEKVIRERIIATVYSLFTWTEGDFSFKPCEAEQFDDIARNSQQLMLSRGLNTQLLAMESTHVAVRTDSQEERGGAECRAAVQLPDDPQPVATTLGQVTDAPPVSLVIIDDDAQTLRLLSEGFHRLGYKVHSLSGASDALGAIERMVSSGEPPTLLVDLIMPRMDGSGVLGGLELLEQVRGTFSELPIMIMSDYHHDEAESRLRALNCPFLLKPRRAKICKPEEVQEFIAAVHQQLSTCAPEHEPSR